jgi:hypothetical protein
VFFAESVAATGNRDQVRRVAALLHDDVFAVREAAATALSTFALKPWGVRTSVFDALAWWNEHEGEFQVDAELQNGDK